MKTESLEKFLSAHSERFGFSFGIAPIAAETSSEEAIENALQKLSPEERVAYLAKRNEKRKREWLAGRMAAKSALARLLDVKNEQRLVVLNGKNRAPFVLSFPDVTVSISHSKDYAVAVAARYRIGIDLEHIEKRPPALLKYFFGEQEQNALPRDGEEKEKLVSLFWTRKEAASKVVKLGGALDFKKINVVNDSTLVEYKNDSSFMTFLSSTTAKYAISVAIES